MRRPQRPLVWAVTLVTLGSGLVNLLSVIGPALPERAMHLHKVFPLEFVHLARFATLLIGFILIISSVNIYKRKKRAFQVVLLFSCLSVAFHLTKGLDYEEAILSVALIGLLLLARKSFVVESSIPDLRWGFVRLALALAVALLYGIAGFWLLDVRAFAIDFTVGDSIRRTLRFLSLAGDPGIVPRTRYAHWFIDSLYLMTSTAIAYSVFAIFRPVVYRYRTLPQERARAEQLTVRYGRCTLDFFKYWHDKSFFFSATGQCYIAYRVGGGYALALGDPVGPEEEIEPAIRRFEEFCTHHDWRTAFHQTLPDFLAIYKKLGFRRLKIGDDAIVDLTQFSLEGKQFKKLRSKVNQMEKTGIRLVHYAPPIRPEVLAELQEVSDGWLEIPGRRERTFTLGLFERGYVGATPVYTAADLSGRILAFVNVIPSYCKGETTIDLMRHRPEAPNGVMDYVLTKLMVAQKEQGFLRFNMGMAPMAGFQEKEEASLEERAVHNFLQRLNFLFSYEGLRQYKAKFATIWEPRYLIYRNVLNLPRVARAIAEVSEIRE